MAFFSGTAPRATGFDTALSLRTALLSSFERRRRIAHVRRELATLSDRNLADIGILRTDIDAIARRTIDAA